MQFKKIRIRKAAGKKKSQGGQNALNKLNSFLNAASAEPAYILHSTWTNQQNAITYKEIREAIMNGHMSESTFQQWQQDYSKMVSDKLSPVWVKAMETASLGVQEQHDSFFFDHTWPGVTKWVQEHGAEFVTNISAEQKNAVSALIARECGGVIQGNTSVHRPDTAPGYCKRELLRSCERFLAKE